MLLEGLPACTATPTGMLIGASKWRFGTLMTGGGSRSGSGIDFVVALPPPAQDAIISETTAMRNGAEYPGRLNRFIIVQYHSEHLRDDPGGARGPSRGIFASIDNLIRTLSTQLTMSASGHRQSFSTSLAQCPVSAVKMIFPFFLSPGRHIGIQCRSPPGMHLLRHAL